MRLSHPDFIEWFKINDNKNRLINFSENNLIIKQDIPMHMGTLRFNDEWSDEKKRRFIEVE